MAEDLKNNSRRKFMRTLQRFLPVFEASARLGSFTAAGDEIGLSQSAVSKQIKSLEEVLGKVLFTRQHKKVELSVSGEALFRAYQYSFRHLMDAVDEIRFVSDKKHLAISTSTANAAFLLLPNLATIRACFPGTDISIVTGDPQGIGPSDSVDLYFVFGQPDFDGLVSMPLFSDVLTPVCSPYYLEHHKPIESLDDLLSRDLISMQVQHPSWIGWRQWLRAFSRDLPTEHMPITFNNYYHVMQACLAGQGVALGWLSLLADPLREGTLVAPLSERLETQDVYHLSWSSSKKPAAPLEPFIEWLTMQLNEHS